MALDPGSHIGPYRIEGRLGAGGMGEVYKAVQVNLQRVVALKVMKPELAADRDFVERFMREARAGAAISHPHVVAIHDADTRDGLLYLAFEFVSGGDLAQLLQKRGPLPSGEALRLLAECADGLQAIHQAGMLHRDLKPQNIFLDGAGRAKLGDLGLARSAVGDDRMTVTGAAMGTPAFMAPEQAEGVADIDIRADIHALGGTLYTLLTGQLPFAAATPWAVVAKVMSQPPPDPRTVVPGIPGEVVALVYRAMAKRREDRFATPADLRAEVLRVAGNIGPGAFATPGVVSQLPSTPVTGSDGSGTGRGAGMAPTVLTAHGLPANSLPRPPAYMAPTAPMASSGSGQQATLHPTVPAGKRGAPVAIIAVVGLAVAAVAAVGVALMTGPGAAPVVVGGGSGTVAAVVEPHEATVAAVAPVVAPVAVAPVEVAPVVVKPVAPVVVPVVVKADPKPEPKADPKADPKATEPVKPAKNDALAAKRAPLLVLDTAATPPADIETSLDLYAVVVGPDDADLKRWRGKIASIAHLHSDLNTFDAEKGLRAGEAEYLGKLDALTALVGKDDPDVVQWRQMVEGPAVPTWASGSGKDDHGRWCEVTANGVVQRMRLVRSGGFTMGSPSDEEGRAADEVEHHVTVNDYWMADSPCTQKMWVAVMGANPSYFTNDSSRPVEQVSWKDCQGFVSKLTQMATGHADDATDASVTVDLVFRLPTEAEWEYAARAGTTGAYGGDGVIADMGWTVPADGEAMWTQALADGKNQEIIDFMRVHAGTGSYQTRAVKKKQPNAWGIYDMHGNVWQWCQDAYKPYDAGNEYDPVIEPDAEHKDRVNRGGAWSHPAHSARSAARAHDEQTLTDWALGFRFVAAP